MRVINTVYLCIVGHRYCLLFVSFELKSRITVKGVIIRRIKWVLSGIDECIINLI